jgi:hypothetical protein
MPLVGQWLAGGHLWERRLDVSAGLERSISPENLQFGNDLFGPQYPSVERARVD